MSLPDSIVCKLFRAQEHLNDLQTEALKYYEKNPAKLVRQQEGAADEFVGKIVSDVPIPKRIPLIVGDYLQNLRSSLDYLVWELVLAAKNQPTKDNMFPICTTEKAFDAQLARRRLEGMAVDAIAEIKALQPYHDGQPSGNVLAVIDDLCNINKHRRVLTTFVRGSQVPSHFTTHETDGQTFLSGDFQSILDQGTTIGPFPMIDGPHGRAPKVDVPLQIVSFIALDEGATKDVEIGHALSIFGGYVSVELMPKFERFFA